MTAVALPTSVQSLPDLIALMCPAYSCWNLGNMVDNGTMVASIHTSVYTRRCSATILRKTVAPYRSPEKHCAKTVLLQGPKNPSYC
jgi:hypothetical protein